MVAVEQPAPSAMSATLIESTSFEANKRRVASTMRLCCFARSRAARTARPSLTVFRPSEVKVRHSSTNEEINFSPDGGTLNEKETDCVAPPVEEFNPRVTDSDVEIACVGDPQTPQITVTLDNTDSTISANFTIAIEI